MVDGAIARQMNVANIALLLMMPPETTPGHCAMIWLPVPQLYVGVADRSALRFPKQSVKRLSIVAVDRIAVPGVGAASGSTWSCCSGLGAAC